MGATVNLLYILSFFAINIQITAAYAYDSPPNHAKVLILGAGVSGIQAAETLHKNDYTDYIVIEGADYAGGRVKNANFSGITVGVGAQWTPADDKDDIGSKILNDWNVQGHKVNFESLVFRNTSGHEVPGDVTGQVWAKLETALAKAAEIGQDILDNDRPDVSQRTALLQGGWKARTPLERLIEWFSFDFESAEPISVTSLLSGIFRDPTGAHYITDQRGYASIFEEMAPSLYQDENVFNYHVRLNHVVTSIDYSQDDAVIVTCADGTVYTGEYVLITFNLAVFQNNFVEYIPELPDWKSSILYQYSAVAYTTIYLSFAERFWDEAETILNVDERYNYYHFFLNFDAFGILPDDVYILSTHILGDEAWRIEYQSEEKTKSEIEEVLQKMYGLETPPQAIEILVYSWLRDPLQGGAFINRPAEVQPGFTSKLQSRVDRLFFGGEITGSSGRGSIGNAFESGTREALKIIECIEGGDCPTYQQPEGCECDGKPQSGKQRKNCSVAKCYQPGK